MLFWILGLLSLSFVLYPRLVKRFPLRMIQYQHYIDGWYISSFSILLFFPAVEITLKVFKCRFRDNAGAYVSVFDAQDLPLL
jgi:hypothetical protein